MVMNVKMKMKYNFKNLSKPVLLFLLSGLAVILGPGLSQAAGPQVIKVATLAPKGTGFYQVLENIAEDWSRISNGQVTMRIYPSGIVGDEQDVIRKIRIDQIQAGAVTSKGLFDIDPNVYGLNYPMMVHTWDELDWLRDRLGGFIQDKIEQKGFKLLFWADVGWIYFFSTKPIHVPEDVRNLKLFTRATDFDDLQLWKTAGFNPVPLTTNDVLPGLQTGLVNVIQSPAFIALSSQWFGIANHMLDLRWAVLTGGFIISRKAWGRIPEQYRNQLEEAAIQESKMIQDSLRYQSDDAIDIMKQHGLTVYEPTQAERQEWLKETESYYPKFKGILVPAEMHERVMKLWPELKAYRATEETRVTSNK